VNDTQLKLTKPWAVATYFATYSCEATQFIHVKQPNLFMWSNAIYSCEATQFIHVKQRNLFMWSNAIYSCEATPGAKYEPSCVKAVYNWRRAVM